MEPLVSSTEEALFRPQGLTLTLGEVFLSLRIPLFRILRCLLLWIPTGLRLAEYSSQRPESGI